MSETVHAFGPFTLTRGPSGLRRQGQPVPLGPRTLELLLLLVERASQVVSKQELMQRLWPDTVVDDSTLRFHVALLRRTLGEGSRDPHHIATISGRGYCFAATVQQRGGDARALPEAAAPRAARLLGRESLLAELAARLPERRFVNIVGPGGMGKSSVAQALAEQLAPGYAGGAQALDASLVASAPQLATTLAHQLGIACSPDGVLDALCRWLRQQRTLILLDGCEAQPEACAALASRLIADVPGLHVLATSREALRVAGEWVVRLPALGLPAPPWSGLSAEDALAHPALRLLVERGRAVRPDFAIGAADVPALCELGQRLDGMPLAIELAAVRLGALSITDLLAQLQTRFLLKSPGRRAGVDRHRTLGALLDWSHERLGRTEQLVLRRLAVCNGPFSLEAARAVAADDDVGEAAVIEAVMGLAAKSLLAVDGDAHTTRYRLLASTRDYALDKLGDGAEQQAARLRQCAYLREMMLRAETDWSRLSATEWLDAYAPFNNDVRGVLAWAFGPAGDAVQGVRLVGSAVSFGYQLALVDEYRGHVQQALQRLPELHPPDPQLELRLRASLAMMLLLSEGPGPGMSDACARTLALAERLDSNRYRVEALNGLFVQAYFGDGDYPEAARRAQQVADIAARSPELALAPLVERLRLQALHGLGMQDEARGLVEFVLRHPPPRQRLKPPFPIDVPVMMRMMQVRILWLQGQPETAWQVAEELLELAARDVRYALSNALAWSVCPLALWRGDDLRARSAIDRMHRHACEIDMPFALAWACAYDRLLAGRTGGPARLAGDPARVTQACATGVVSELLGTIDAQAISERLLARSRAGTLGWCAPEILRGEGELLMARHDDPRPAWALFEQALALARSQGALAWELRAATSLAQLPLPAAPARDARARLAAVYERFREGFQTRDLRLARAVLDEAPVAP